MRVIAGTHGGRGLRAPAGTSTRPTSDRVREALFSMLGSVTGDRVLDLFAGSGALAIEAISRGAGEAVLIDDSRDAVAAIRTNLRTLGITAEVRLTSARAYLDAASRRARQYDLVFLDPPYRLAGELNAQLSVDLPPVLASGARVVAESDVRSALELNMPLLRERRYGDTLIRIYEAP
jgi:16S rRNA (guanine966-N2)-methyltransferase